MRKRWTNYRIAFMCLILSNTALAEDQLVITTEPAIQQKGKPHTDPIGTITKLFESNDDASISLGILRARSELNNSRFKSHIRLAQEALPGWLRILSAQKRVDRADELAFTGIASSLDNLPLIEQYQETRVKIMLAAGRIEEASELAKGFYDVCSMPNTSHAIDIISECIYDNNKDKDPAGAVKQFKLEQVEGAAPPADGQHPSTSSVLANIKIKTKAYEDAALDSDMSPANKPLSLFAQGNLLLLVDRAQDAKKLFDKAYAVSSDKDAATLTEGIARATRAEDGTVGRANAWILSLRPQNTDQQAQH